MGGAGGKVAVTQAGSSIKKYFILWPLSLQMLRVTTSRKTTLSLKGTGTLWMGERWPVTDSWGPGREASRELEGHELTSWDSPWMPAPSALHSPLSRNKTTLTPDNQRERFILEANMNAHGPEESILVSPNIIFQQVVLSLCFYSNRTNKTRSQDTFQTHWWKQQVGRLRQSTDFAALGLRGCMMTSALGLEETC